MGKTTRSTPEDRARKRVKNFTDLMWHIATYVIVNAFLWLITPAGAFWVTIGWGLGLAFHIAAYLLDENGGQDRRYQRFLAEEQERENRNSV
ncbi:MAG: 2TM domain-containing protein [Actinomycetota bacterium]|nr:2TM domain-containing protein [Actinomycetota bacterium]